MNINATQSPALRVLVVDDEEPLRRFLQRTIQSHGHACDVAANGNEGFALSQQAGYDVVVTDLSMPDCNGHEMCCKLVRENNRPGIVVLTGVMEPKLAKDLTSRGVEEIVYKPINPADLVARVEAIAWKRNIRKSNLKTRDHQSDAATSTIENIPEATSVQANPSPAARHAEPQAKSVPRDLTGKHVVAVLLQSLSRGQEVADVISSQKVAGVACGSSEDLCRLLNEERVEIVIIQQELGGFLSGIEILERLQQDMTQCESILLADSIAGVQIQADKLGVDSVLELDESRENVSAAVKQLLRSMNQTTDFIPRVAQRFVEKCDELPPFPQLLVKLLVYLEMDVQEIPLDELADDIATDSRATAELLRLTNSSGLGLRNEIHRIGDAVNLLGPKRAISLIFSSSAGLAQSHFADLPDKLRSWYQQRAILIANAASTFAERLERVSPDMAYTLGMLQELGILLIALRNGKRYVSLLERFRSTALLQLDKLERQEFSMTHADVTAALLQHWGLPQSLIRPVLEHHQQQPSVKRAAPELALVRVMRIGEAVANMVDVPQPFRRKQLNDLLAHYGRSKSDLCQIAMREAITRTREDSQMFDVPVPDMATLNRLIDLAQVEAGV